MATRLFCRTLMRQMRQSNAQKKLCVANQISNHELFHATMLGGGSRQEQFRLLHVKVYDKDADLETQREFNRYKPAQELVEEVGKETAENHAKVASNRKVRSKDIKELLKVKEKAPAKSFKGEMFADTDPDTFGNAKTTDENEVDEGDLLEEQYISQPTRVNKKLRTKEYANLIKDHLKAHRVQDAIAVLEQRMLKEDRVKPENYIYNLLISGCAKAGNTRKAFSLFTKMRQRGLKVKPSTYTSLFNACANAPLKTEGLERANYLREEMLEKGYEPNVKNYNAMIKAYGRCGDVKTAYLLADEMLERQLEMDSETFNFLLQACASDAQLGFRHCLLTWHKMLQRGISPDYYSFHTVLRCARDCSFGDLQTMHEVLQKILTERDAKEISTAENQHVNQLLLNAGLRANEEQQQIEIKKAEPSVSQPEQMQSQPDQRTLETESSSSNLQESQLFEQQNKTSTSNIAEEAINAPNLLALRPHLGNLVALSEVKLPHERFLLLGGLTGFLDLMKQNNITPNIQMFTTILEVIPPTYAAEKQVITFIRKIGLKADIDFFNVLIKKRSMRFDYEGAKEVMSMIKTAKLHPDIVTYGVLALGCQTEETARELLQEMLNNDVRMNIQILGAMLRQGSSQKNFAYVTSILQISLDEEIKPNDIFLRHLSTFYNRCARAIDARHPYTKNREFKKGHAKFCDKLRLYYEEHNIAGLQVEDAIKKLRERPYQQYKERTIDGAEPLKNEKLVSKNKLRKYIKKIKISNLRSDEDDASSNAAKPTKQLESSFSASSNNSK